MNQQKTTNGSATMEMAADRALPAEPTISDVAESAYDAVREYARQRPDVVAMWCFGIGFVAGWKLKPW